MEKILADNPPPDSALLPTAEDHYDQLAISLVNRLQKSSTQQLASQAVLDALDPSLHTIPYLIALDASIQTAAAAGKAAPRQLPSAVLPEGALWPYITPLLLNFDPIQVRYVGEYLTKLVHIVVAGAELTQNFIPAIQLLQSVILRLDPSSSTFTSTHHSYVRLCLLAGAYAEALTIIDQPIYHIPSVLDKATEPRTYKYRCSRPDTSAAYLTPNMGLTYKITSKGYLEYYIWGALCHIGLGQYSKAIAFLEVVIVAPTHQNTASMIQVEAYKKWLLLNLLVKGYVGDMPRPTSQGSIKHIQAVAKPYLCLVDAFKTGNAQRLHAEVEQGNDFWHEDRNFGLVEEVFSALRRFSVIRLGKTYSAIPVSQATALLGYEQADPAQVISFLQSLIASGELNAIINPSKSGNDQTLRFLPDKASQRPESQIEQELATRSQKLQVLLKHISDLDHRMEISKEYTDYLRKLKRQRDEDKKTDDSGGGEAGKTRRAPMVSEEMDEDMMGGSDEL